MKPQLFTAGFNISIHRCLAAIKIYFGLKSKLSVIAKHPSTQTKDSKNIYRRIASTFKKQL